MGSLRLPSRSRNISSCSQIMALTFPRRSKSPGFAPIGRWFLTIPRWFPKGYVGIPSRPTFAFNSASMLPVSALRQIRSYSQWFWLDHCDSYLFHRLHLYGKRVFVVGDVKVGHEFSMLDQKKRMSILRYHNILMAETAFWDSSMNRLAGCERTLRLIGHGARLLSIVSHETCGVKPLGLLNGACLSLAGSGLRNGRARWRP